jgi:glycosyltransferase involved in cell wall biosynthesis
MDKTHIPKVTIGLPVYNGELSLSQSIDSVLKQSFTDFELIISDNASTDSTLKICEKYLNKDSRITLVKQNKNIGPLWNFYFILEKARGNYFVWLADDDYWHPDFLLENVSVLDNHKNVVCSIGKINPFDKLPKNGIKEESVKYPKLAENYVMNRRNQMISVTFPVSGSYSKKIRQFLKNTGATSRFYGLYRKEILQKCFIKSDFVAVVNAIFLNLLKYGDLYEVDKILLYRFNQGSSTTGIINQSRLYNKIPLGTIFPYISFNSWCLKNIGLKNVLRNLDIFARMNVGGFLFFGIDLILKIRNRFL